MNVVIYNHKLADSNHKLAVYNQIFAYNLLCDFNLNLYLLILLNILKK